MVDWVEAELRKNQQTVWAKYPEAEVSLNQYAYTDAFGDIPYEIVVCGPRVNGEYSGPIYLARDCRSHREAWAEAAEKVATLGTKVAPVVERMLELS